MVWIGYICRLRLVSIEGIKRTDRASGKKINIRGKIMLIKIQYQENFSNYEERRKRKKVFRRWIK